MPLPLPAPAAPPASPAPAAAYGAYGRPTAVRPLARPAAPAAANPYAAQANRYREAELQSATPGQLVVLLYDKLQLTLRRARVALDSGRVEERTEQLLRAHDMFTELRCCLDHEQGGAIAAQLDGLYAWAIAELMEANRLRDGQKIDHVLRMAGELREAFAGALAQLGGATPSATAAPTPAPAAAVPQRQARSA